MTAYLSGNVSTIRKTADWVNSVWGAITALGMVGLAAISAHNWWFMEQMSPVIRASLVSRINNYRALECAGRLGDDQRVAFDLAMAQYEELVGREMGNGTGCDGP